MFYHCSVCRIDTGVRHFLMALSLIVYIALIVIVKLFYFFLCLTV